MKKIIIPVGSNILCATEAKKKALDICTNFFETLFFGNSRHTKDRVMYATPYASYKKGKSFDTKDFHFDYKEDAELALNEIQDHYNIYHKITVHELCDISGINPDKFYPCYSNFGWTIRSEINSASVESDGIGYGYFINISDPHCLNKEKNT